MCVKLVSVYSPPITQYAMVASRHRECAARIAEPAEGCNRGPSGARPRSHRHEEEAMIDETDLRHLRRCVALAREALEAGDSPFGSVLVAAGGAVLAEDRNRVSGGDRNRHPEFALDRWAAEHMAPAERRSAGASCRERACKYVWISVVAASLK